MIKDLVLNSPQAAAVVAVTILKKTKIFLEWARGTGKSFILAWFMRLLVIQMPRASFALVGSTYQQILSRTLPSTKEALALLGIYENIDYVVGKSGAKLGFKEPFQSPDKWDNIIHFSNGCIFQLVSLDNPNSGRGLNAYAVLGDEAALFDYERLFNNVKTTNRSKKTIFKNASLLGAEIYASSTPLTKKGKWFTDAEKLAKKNPKKYAYIKASALANKENLRKEWFKEMRDEAPSDVIYNAEILNIRPNEILDGFYPQFDSSKHCYSNERSEYLETLIPNHETERIDCLADGDIIPTMPLRLSIDWGVFVGAITGQKLKDEFRTLKDFYVKQPKDVEDLIKEWCEYYDPHPTKLVYLYYGHDGNATIKASRSRETYGDMVANLLRKNGWRVVDKSKGRPVARHNDKYILTNRLLKQTVSRFPKLTFNEHNCQNLVVSIERAEAKEGPNGVQKVKKDEKNQSIKQETTTHLSDAWDIMIYEEYHSIVDVNSASIQLPLTTS